MKKKLKAALRLAGKVAMLPVQIVAGAVFLARGGE
jgi:hypothetical protein